jgi:hypothetical protein
MNRWIVKELCSEGFVYARGIMRHRSIVGVQRVRTQREATKFANYEDAIACRRAFINDTTFAVTCGLVAYRRSTADEILERKGNIRILRLR